MQNSPIEWTDLSWNPVTGCTKVSQGCKNCYAERMHDRFNGKGSFKNVICHPDRLMQPLKIKDSKKIFVNSMSDLFHEDVPFEFIDKVFAIMAICPQHTFQILTKRHERMLEYFSQFKTTLAARWSIAIDDNLKAKLIQRKVENEWPLPNVWIGVSCEDQATANNRIPYLLQTPAAIHFLSCEPLLGLIDLTEFAFVPLLDECPNKIDWVITGGESGPGARPMHPDWVCSLRDQCNASGISFFFKQWGEYLPFYDGEPGELIAADGLDRIEDLPISILADKVTYSKIGKKKAGNHLYGIQHLQFPNTKTHA